MNKEYIYLGQYYHKHGKDLQELGITEKKIGKTKNPDSREKGLNSTKMTIGYKYIAIWEVKNMDIVETIFHTAFDDNRLSGEWFEDPNDDMLERIDKILRLSELGTKTYEDTVDIDENQIKTPKGRIKSLTVTYNDKEYVGNGTQVMIDVCNQIIEDKGLNKDNLEDLYLIRKEGWENPNDLGRYYTKKLNNNLHVVTCISGNRKKNKLEELKDILNLNLTVELN